jgi:hypothetical protein
VESNIVPHTKAHGPNVQQPSRIQHQLWRKWVSSTSQSCLELHSSFSSLSVSTQSASHFTSKMALNAMSRLFVLLAITLLSAIHVSAQTAASSATVTTAPRTTTAAGNNSTSTRSRSSAATAGAPPDVYLNVPELHVGRIELTVDELKADINLNAKVANLVQLNAGVQVSIQKVNITIAEVDAEVELVVRLGEFSRHKHFDNS